MEPSVGDVEKHRGEPIDGNPGKGDMTTSMSTENPPPEGEPTSDIRRMKREMGSILIDCGDRIEVGLFEWFAHLTSPNANTPGKSGGGGETRGNQKRRYLEVESCISTKETTFMMSVVLNWVFHGIMPEARLGDPLVTVLKTLRGSPPYFQIASLSGSRQLDAIKEAQRSGP